MPEQAKRTLSAPSGAPWRSPTAAKRHYHDGNQNHEAQDSLKLDPALRLRLTRILPIAFIVIALILQLLLRDAKLHYSHIFTGHPFLRNSFSPPAKVLLPEPVCENQPFPTSAPVSLPLTMALATETKDIVSQFELTDADVNKGVQEFLRQMGEGLDKQGTSISQIPTYVTAVPNGTEKGLYLAVDLGGTNLRVCSVKLNGDTTFNLTFSKAPIPKELMTAKTSQELFAFIAKQIDLFLQTHHGEHYETHVRKGSTGGYTDEQTFQLGFTFSFPVNQSGINKGTLLRWTKGFDIADAVGKDVCAMLQEEIDKLNLPVKVAALVNDTVGTLMARSYTSPGKNGSILGAIFGTGTNGAYIEKLENIKKSMEGDYDKSTGEMVVNTEWGSFDNQLNVLPTTPWDTKLDKDSVNPGIQMFEKRVSGMFLGEILRLALVDMLGKETSTLFKSDTAIPESSGLLTQWGLDSSLMSIAAQDTSSDLSNLRQALEAQLAIPSPSLESAQAFQAIAAAVGRRSARLSAVAVAAIVLQTGKLTDPAWKGEEIDVGVDGSLVEHYPKFREMITEAMGAVEGIGSEGAARIRIGIAKDGSGVGAALIALVAAGMDKKVVA